jgi:hypothetical protein
MRALKGVLPIAVSAGIVLAVTAVLWRVNEIVAGSRTLPACAQFLEVFCISALALNVKSSNAERRISDACKYKLFGPADWNIPECRTAHFFGAIYVAQIDDHGLSHDAVQASEI